VKPLRISAEASTPRGFTVPPLNCTLQCNPSWDAVPTLLPIRQPSTDPTPKGKPGFEPWPRGAKVSPKTLSGDPLAGEFPGAASPSPCGFEEESQQHTSGPPSRQAESIPRFRVSIPDFATEFGAAFGVRYAHAACSDLSSTPDSSGHGS
jgi:hypothetical protein